MPLKKLQFQPGINREISRSANEQGWYDCDKVRFRKGFPERIGGWARFSSDLFLGVCRSLWPWSSIGNASYLGLGTSIKFYVSTGGVLFDVTPLRKTAGAGATTFSATDGSPILTVVNLAHGAQNGDFVTFSGANTLGGAITADVLNREYEITNVVDENTFEIVSPVIANASDTGDSGVGTVAEYQVSIGAETVTSAIGWGSGPWSSGTWGNSDESASSIRIWNQGNFGEDLVFGPAGGPLYYWDLSAGTDNRAVLVSTLAGASEVPTVQDYLIVSDLFRFAFVFGTNPIGQTGKDALLIRWSDQEDITNWSPQATNQAGSLRLSRGSQIVSALQARQEILVFTDTTLYALQFVGGLIVWGAQLVGSNISIVSSRAAVYTNSVCYWMGKDGFYAYDGRVQPLRCDVLRYVYDDINREQFPQVFAGTLEEFDEVWFFYCSAGSETVDRYVIYNYADGTWAYGTLARTAWVDSSLFDFPIAATYKNTLVEHENGLDDNEDGVVLPVNAFIQSGDFDLDDGDRVMFVWRCLPDINFAGSRAINPILNMSFSPRYTSGAPLNNPASVGNVSGNSVIRTKEVPVEEFTEQLNIRVRGRQVALRIESNSTGVQWQLGTPRLEMRPDGRR